MMKETLASKFGDEVRQLATAMDVLDPALIKKTIHTTHAQAAIDSLEPNPVLGTAAPPIDASELTLDRKTRTRLAQLRSGHSSMLKSYMARINPDEHQDLCPDCQGSQHNTVHLFNCPARSTTLSPLSLWTLPTEAANFLKFDQIEPR